jgi:diguanylate cyclase (GGDEF)-like protein
VIIDRDGSPVRAVGFVVDVTDSWLAEQNLIATNALLQEENKHLLRQTLVDALTGIANRRRLDQELERACLHAARARQSLSIALMDIDHFKAYNDHYGHPQGDRALALVAESIASAAWRPYDVAARYGGEEFAVLLPGSSDPGLVMEKIRKSIEQRALPHEYSPTHTVLTISCGCLTTSDPQKLVPNYLLEACDELLYRAKTQGRNCLVLQTA